MNLRKTCPDIPDTWRGGVSQVAIVLGEDRPVSRDTVRKYIRSSGIKPVAGLGNRAKYSGKDVKYLWSLI